MSDDLPLSIFEDAQLQANLRSIRAALNGEQARVKFIREAVILLDAAMHGKGVVADEGKLWARARVLWDAKPEDC